MRVMITGGGTGGHISPAVALIEELRRRDPQLLLQWIGRRGGMEARASQVQGIPFRGLPVEGWPRRNSLRRPWVAAKLAWSMMWAVRLVWRFRPQVVIGVGGYVSLPLMWVAQRLGVPTVLHEQNKFLGMANRMLAPRADRIFLSYPDTIGVYPKERARVVGNPVRAGFLAPPSAEEARKKMGLDPKIPVILVSGGSQGAKTLNDAVAHALLRFEPGEIQLIWMTGAAGVAQARQAAAQARIHVDVFPYIEDMVTASAAADVLVGRSGASSMAEIAVLGKPSILVPFPHATDNHQEKNARAFEDVGAALVVLDHECSGEVLLSRIRGLLCDPEKRKDMAQAALKMAKPLAAESMVEEIILLVFGESSTNE